MSILNVLPKSAIVNRIIPKNAFDKYSTTAQKKLFSEKIERIRWTHKLAFETINLPGKEIKEIQAFKIELRSNEQIDDIIKIIDKAIPYPILFYLNFNSLERLIISKKHPNPINDDNAVIDWTFKSEWFTENMMSYSINLKESIDFVFENLCRQLSSQPIGSDRVSINEIILKEQKIKEIKNQIQKLESAIATTKQFNIKVELNIKLNEARIRLNELL